MYKAFNFAHAGNLIDDVDGVFAEALTNSFHPPKKKKTNIHKHTSLSVAGMILLPSLFHFSLMLVGKIADVTDRFAKFVGNYSVKFVYQQEILLYLLVHWFHSDIIRICIIRIPLVV